MDRYLLNSLTQEFLFSLRNLCGLCVSAVNLKCEELTAETPRAQQDAQSFLLETVQ